MNIVFDFGAVLFDWRPAERVQQRLSEWAPGPQEARTLAQAIFAHADWQAFDRGLLRLEQVVERTAYRLSLPVARVNDLMAPIGHELEPIEANVALLQALAKRREREGGLRLFFLSNMPEPFARTLERRHAFIEVFDGGLFSGDAKLGKPEPAIYQQLAAAHQLVPQKTWFVDDHLPNVDAARALGWQGLHVSEPQALADLLGSALP
ncbi:MAG: HAD-IA family hydrolase [Betaproteobacteria bacterium]